MNKYFYILLLAMLATSEAEAADNKKGQVQGKPRLVVNITIDQMRRECLDLYMPYFAENGLKRILANGRCYEDASYPLYSIDRASASAVISTGSVPFFNGIPSAEWLSRSSLRTIRCTTDRRLSDVAQFNDPPSAANLNVSTIGDEMKIASEGEAKVFSVAPNCDAAILSAGHAADGAFWIDSRMGEWITSDYYMTKRPTWLSSFNRFSAPKVVKKSAYDATYLTSSSVNVDVTDMALQCVTANAMGNDNITDLLAIQYYAGTYTGKNSANKDAELRNVYCKIDAEIARLVDFLDKRLKLENILFVVTSTGYYDDELGDYINYKVPSGSVYINRTCNYLNMFLGGAYGKGNYVEGYYDDNIYLNHKLIEQKQLDMNELLSRSRDMLLLSDGIVDVYTSYMMKATASEAMRLHKNSYAPGVSGDIVIEVAPGWKITDEPTHRTQPWHPACPAFPIVFFGADVKPGVVSTPVTTDQIAPTICKSIRIRAPNACKSAPLY